MIMHFCLTVLACFLLTSRLTSAFAPVGFRHCGAIAASTRASRDRSSSSSLLALTTGEFEDEISKFETTNYVSATVENLKQFEVQATVPRSTMNEYLDEYKGEMAKRKVVFPGFRPGKLPPYVMGDVRKYIVSFAIETLLSGIANLNGLQFCTEEGAEVQFGEDTYYEDVIGDWEKTRDAWRENTDFRINAKFFALVDPQEGEEEEQAEVQAVAHASGGADDGVIDVEAEVSDA